MTNTIEERLKEIIAIYKSHTKVWKKTEILTPEQVLTAVLIKLLDDIVSEERNTAYEKGFTDGHFKSIQLEQNAIAQERTRCLDILEEMKRIWDGGRPSNNSAIIAYSKALSDAINSIRKEGE